jgi:hypothetical protein
VNSRIRSCFISAIAGTNLQTLREVLAEKGVEVVVPEGSPSGSDWPTELTSIISRVDLVIGVLTQEERWSWVLFELGQAIALKRQVILFAPPPIKIFPPDLQRFLVVRAGLKNRGAISFAVDQVLAAPPATARYRELKPSERRYLGPQADRFLHEIRWAIEKQDWQLVELTTREALKLSGVDVISQVAISNRDVDLAIWSDALQPTMGNPLLVEVKGRLLDVDTARKAAQQLSILTTAAGTEWGLLLYGDTSIIEDGLRFATPPNVLVLSLTSLFEQMKTRPFAEIVKDLRNRRVHGVNP